VIDIHSHVLYGLDDGPTTREASLQMLEHARLAGTTDIVATPHANGRYIFNPVLVDQRIAELQAYVDLRIYPGCDFHLQFDNIQDAVANPEKYTINHNGYLLVEFSDFSVFSRTDEILGCLLDAEMVPIITHPERNIHLQRRRDDLSRWIEMGCYVQLTAGSCTGHFGKRASKCAYELIRHGLVHFVASDAHDCRDRSPSLREAYSSLAGEWGEESIRPLFVDNPKSALMGESLAFELPPSGLTTRKWFQFWA
jgi:protein-tyrosine phosphatase